MKKRDCKVRSSSILCVQCLMHQIRHGLIQLRVLHGLKCTVSKLFSE